MTREKQLKEDGRKRLGCWRWPLTLVAGISLYFTVMRVIPAPKLRIAPSTTHITTPLDNEGLPDYFRYINESNAKDMTVDENAAVPLWQTMWTDQLTDGQTQELAIALDLDLDVMSPLSELDDRYFLELLGYDPDVHRQVSAIMSSDELRGQFSSIPWDAASFPELASWFDRNRGHIEAIVAATDRSRFYSPLLEVESFGRSSGLVGAAIPDSEMLRSAVRLLAIRAMLGIKERRIAEAWRDIRAILLLARLASQGPSLIHRLVGCALESVGVRSTQRLIGSGRCTVNDLKTIHEDLLDLPPLPRMAETIGGYERLAFLDTVVRLAEGKWDFSDISSSSSPTGGTSAKSSKLNWNLVLESGNRWFDRAEEIARLPRAERIPAGEQFDEEIYAMLRKSPMKLLGSFLSRTKRSEFIGNMLIGVYLPAVVAACDAMDRADTERQLTQLVVALELYHEDNGEYPAALDELYEDWVPENCVDVYSGAPYIYERRSEGYVLYSVFVNGRDDGGDHFDSSIIDGEWNDEDRLVGWKQSDWVIRFPLKPVSIELPEVTPEPPFYFEDEADFQEEDFEEEDVQEED